MSVGPLGGALGSAAGVPLSQTKGSEAERAAHDTADSQRRIKNAQKAENAAGIAEADGEGHDTNERDADGRRLFEAPPEAPDRLFESVARPDGIDPYLTVTAVLKAVYTVSSALGVEEQHLSGFVFPLFHHGGDIGAAGDLERIREKFP